MFYKIRNIINEVKNLVEEHSSPSVCAIHTLTESIKIADELKANELT